VWVTSSLTTARRPTVVALGNFDGIHRGHQQVIQAVTTDPKLLAVTTAAAPPIPTVVTFDPHPQAFFTGQARTLLTPLIEKQDCLSALGIEQLVLLPFNQVLASLSPQEFVDKILVQGLQVRGISVGFNFRFGHRRQGTTTDLVAIAAAYGVPVNIVPPQCCEAGERISSSSIRQALKEGDLERVQRLLGRPYSVTGQVVQGQQLGRTLGFPTANLALPPDKLLPRLGVYYVRVSGPAWTGTQPGVMNLGYRPTVDGKQLSVEVHLLNWSGDLYGQSLTVQLLQFLRSEQPFSNLEALRLQIQADCAAARTLALRL
jgi:riboflavin kinase / FMN adenylyltransferase